MSRLLLLLLAVATMCLPARAVYLVNQQSCTYYPLGSANYPQYDTYWDGAGGPPNGEGNGGAIAGNTRVYWGPHWGSFHIGVKHDAGDTVHYFYASEDNDNSDMIISLSSCGDNQNCCSKVQWINIDSVYHYYQCTTNGVSVGSVGYGSCAPGGVVNWSGCGTCPFTVGIVDLGNEGGTSNYYGGAVLTNSPAATNYPGVDAQGFPQNGFPNYLTNLVIGQTTNLAGDIALVYGGIQNLSAGLSGQLLSLQTAISNQVKGVNANVYVTNLVSNTLTNVNNVNLTNLNSLTVSNFVTLTNNLGSLSNQLAGISNILGGQVLANWTNPPASGTNADAASSAASAALTTVLPDFDSATNIIGGSESSAKAGMVGDGSPAVFAMGFCGTTLNFDPAVRFPGLLEVVKASWTFILLAVFLWWVAGWVLDIVKMVGTTETGGVPDLDIDVPVIGNAAGVVVAILVPIAFAVLWVVVLKWMTGKALAMVGLLPAASSALGLGGNAGALYLLNAAFPVDLALSLCMARITLPIAASKIAVLAMVATRWLFGR